MGKFLTYIDEYQNLYKALSVFFGDQEIDYSLIASVAQYSPTPWIEKMLFEEVGSVYFTYLRIASSSAWVNLDKEILSRNIQEYKKKCDTNSLFYKVRQKYLIFYLRKKYKCQWKKLKKEIDLLNYRVKAKNMEGKVCTDIDLCESLSDIFIDSETNYIYIVPVANCFPIEHVKKVYFEWVAPVCCPFFVSPLPSKWEWFDRDELWKDIQKYKAKHSNLGFFGKKIHQFSLFYLRNQHIVKSGWVELEKYMNDFKNSDA